MTGSRREGCQLVVGLGNPGREYSGTRHNIGFAVLDQLAMAIDAGAKRSGIEWRAKGNAQIAETVLGTSKVILIKPQTFMNLSGEAVGEMARFFKVDPKEVVVVYDDMDLGFGILKLGTGGGDGGHNGIRSLVQHLGTKDFVRVRFGVGRPFYKQPAAQGDGASWVLGKFDAEEAKELPGLVTRSVEAVREILERGLTLAQNKFHQANLPGNSQGSES